MSLLAPEGSVYQAGTLSGNPIVVTAGKTVLELLKEKNPFNVLEKKTNKLCKGILSIAEKHNSQIRVNSIGSIFSIFFTKNNGNNYEKTKSQNTKIFKKFFHYLLNKGIYFSPSGYEANFLSTLHTDSDINKTLN